MAIAKGSEAFLRRTYRALEPPPRPPGRRWRRRLTIAAIWLGGLILLGWFLLWFFFARGLPSEQMLLQYRAPLPTNVRDVDGMPVAAFARERRVALTYQEFPPQLIHAFIEGAKQIRDELKEAGKPLDTIEQISCQLAEPGLTLVTEPKDRKMRPAHPHEARFSLPFGVATTLIYGDVDVESFRPERLRDEEVLRLAGLVVSSEDPDSDYPQHCPAILEVTSLGKVYRRHVRFHPGSPEAALSESDVFDKFPFLTDADQTHGGHLFRFGGLVVFHEFESHNLVSA